MSDTITVSILDTTKDGKRTPLVVPSNSTVREFLTFNRVSPNLAVRLRDANGRELEHTDSTVLRDGYLVVLSVANIKGA